MLQNMIKFYVVKQFLWFLFKGLNQIVMQIIYFKWTFMFSQLGIYFVTPKLCIPSLLQIC